LIICLIFIKDVINSVNWFIFVVSITPMKVIIINVENLQKLLRMDWPIAFWLMFVLYNRTHLDIKNPALIIANRSKPKCSILCIVSFALLLRESLECWIHHAGCGSAREFWMQLLFQCSVLFDPSEMATFRKFSISLQNAAKRWFRSLLTWIDNIISVKNRPPVGGGFWSHSGQVPLANFSLKIVKLELKPLAIKQKTICYHLSLSLSPLKEWRVELPFK
jgi:hypothetical protein